MYWQWPEEELYWILGQYVKVQGHIWTFNLGRSFCVTPTLVPTKKVLHYLRPTNDTSHIIMLPVTRDPMRIPVDFGAKRWKVKVLDFSSLDPKINLRLDLGLNYTLVPHRTLLPFVLMSFKRTYFLWPIDFGVKRSGLRSRLNLESLNFAVMGTGTVIHISFCVTPTNWSSLWSETVAKDL